MHVEFLCAHSNSVIVKCVKKKKAAPTLSQLRAERYLICITLPDKESFKLETAYYFSKFFMW